jgi:hypothetical protein
MRTIDIASPTPRNTSTRIGAVTAIALATMFGILAYMRPAAAQAACGTHSEVVKTLDKEFGEQPVAVGLSSVGTIIQVFTGRDGNTWTIVATRPNGLTCLVAIGEAWQSLPKNFRGPDS